MDGTVSRTVKEVRDDLIKLMPSYIILLPTSFLLSYQPPFLGDFFFIIITNHTDRSITD